MKDKIKTRIKEEAEYIVTTKDTIRELAVIFGVSKSTVHIDLTTRLKEHNPEQANKVEKIFEHHKSVRHIRGGLSTKKKWAEQRELA